jgi:ATPase subunit of ABC transporter with duplicated ATPase domains
MQKQSKQNNNILDSQNNNEDYNVDENDKLNKGQQQEEENAIVHLNKVSFGYEHHHISLLSLNNISFNIFEDDILGIIGLNDAEKTTLFHSMMELQIGIPEIFFYLIKIFTKKLNQMK